MNRNHNILLGTLLGLILPFSITAAEEEGATDLASAITSGKATVALRYRYEQVDQDSATLDDETPTAVRFVPEARGTGVAGADGAREFDLALQAVQRLYRWVYRRARRY